MIERSINISLTFTLTFFAVFLCVTAQLHAQEAPFNGVDCNTYKSGQTPPTGYGAAWNVLSASREVLVDIRCDFDEEISMRTVGNGNQSQYIYKVSYYFSKAEQVWKMQELSGTFVRGSTDWLAGKGTRVSGIPNVNPWYWVGYLCQWTGSQWKCGCRDVACSQQYWQLQAMTNPYVDTGTPAGGSSGGGTSPAGDNGGQGGTIPAATRTVNVSSDSQLSSALSNAQAGDHIVLANGSYSGFTVSRNGTQNSPVVVRAANKLQAKVSGKITISGNDAWVVGMDISGNVELRGTRSRISSSHIRGNGGSAVGVAASAKGAIVDHNDIDFSNWNKQNAIRGIQTNYSTDIGSSGYNRHIYRNYIHDAGEGGFGDENNALALSSNSGPDHIYNTYNSGEVVEYNLVDRFPAGRFGGKVGGVIYRFNTVLEASDMPNRAGMNQQYIANWLEKNGGIRIYDKGNVLIGNRVVNGAIEIRAGDCTVDERGKNSSTCERNYFAATDSIVAGNIGNLRIGYNFSGLADVPARNTRVEAHQGAIDRGNDAGTTVSETTFRTIPTAFKLTSADVGPNAPTAPSL